MPEELSVQQMYLIFVSNVCDFVALVNVDPII